MQRTPRCTFSLRTACNVSGRTASLRIPVVSERPARPGVLLLHTTCSQTRPEKADRCTPALQQQFICSPSAGRTIPHTEPHRPGPQASDKDFQMGENATPEEAPFPLTEVDKWVLSQTDEEFICHTWDELRHLIRTAICLLVLYTKLLASHLGVFFLLFVACSTDNPPQKTTSSRCSRESRPIFGGT